MPSSSQQSPPPPLLPVIKKRPQQQTPTPKQSPLQNLVDPSPGGSSLDAESDSGTDESVSSEEEEEGGGGGHEAARRGRQTSGEEDEALFERVGSAEDMEEEEEEEEEYEAYDEQKYYEVEEEEEEEEEDEVLMEEEEGGGVQDVEAAARIISGAQQQPSRRGGGAGNDVWEETRSYGGGSAAGGGGGGSGGGGGGWSAFENGGKKALERRAGTGNGGRKGKGWRAAELPVEIISRILIMVADRLVNEAYIGTPRHVETQTSLGYSHRWTLAYLQTRSSLCQIRLVGRSWREAVENLPFWSTLVMLFFGQPTPGKPFGAITLAKTSHWLQSVCAVCLVSGYERRGKVAYPAVPSMYGRIAVCMAHSDQSCSRCLFGPSLMREPTDLDLAKSVERITGGDEDWFGEEEVSSCRDCRLDALQYILNQRGAKPVDIDDEDDPGQQSIYDYIVMGDGDAGSTAVEIVEKRWLHNYTKFSELQEHAMISRRLGRPERRSEEEKKARRELYRGGRDEDDDMDGLDRYDEDDEYEDDFEDSEEEEEESFSLSKGDFVQVAEMALKDWMNQRIVEGFWISPSEQKILVATHRPRDGRKSSSGSIPVFRVARPLLDFTLSDPANEIHVPTVFGQSLPPQGGSLAQGVDFTYGSSLREVIAPAMEQIVRLASFTRDPIKTASSWTTNDIVAFLRLPGAWVAGGLDYIAPDLIAKERSASISSRSSLSSSNGSGRGQTPPSLPQPGRAGPLPPPPSVPSHGIPRDQSPFIGPQPPTDLLVDRDVSSPMHSISSHSHSHSPSPSTTNPSVSTPPSSTSPPTSGLVHPPPSPRKQSIGLPVDPRLLSHPTTGTKTLPGAVPTQRVPPPPPPPPAQLARPIFPIPCIPTPDFIFHPQTQSTIDAAWYDAWEPLRRCLCGICLRGMGYPNGAANGGGGGGGGGGERNGNGKRKETSGGGEDREKGPESKAGIGRGGEEFSFLPSIDGEMVEMLKTKSPEELEELGFMLGEDGLPRWVGESGRGGVGLGVETTTTTKNASSDDDGSVKRARTDTV